MREASRTARQGGRRTAPGARSRFAAVGGSWTESLAASIVRLPRSLCILPIRFYKLCISPLLPPACRFYPTCSTYAMEAITRYGIFRGGYYAARRLLRCHPFCRGGYDPVPGTVTSPYRSH